MSTQEPTTADAAWSRLIDLTKAKLAPFALDNALDNLFRRERPAIEAAIRADALRDAVKTAQARFDDLRWCNKTDNCHDLADGAELVLGDLRAILDSGEAAERPFDGPEFVQRDPMDYRRNAAHRAGIDARLSETPEPAG